MAALQKGSDTQSISGDEIDSIIAIARNTSKTLVPGDDRFITVDSTGGDVTHTLPDPTLAANIGVVFFVKRIDSTANIVKLNAGGNDFDGGSADYFLGNQNEFVAVISDGTTSWLVTDSRTFAVGVLQRVGAATTQAITGTYAKITLFDLATFSTPGRVLADAGTDDIEILDIQSAPADIYRVKFSVAVQFNNNVDVDFAVFVDGVETSVGAQISGNGANDVHLTFEGIVPVATPAPKLIEIRVRGDTDDDLTIETGMNFAVERIGG